MPVVDLTIEYGKVYIVYRYNVLNVLIEGTQYPPGKYTLESCPAATVVIRSLKDSVEQHLSKYFKKGKVKVNVTGFADAIPVSDNCRYQGEFGNPLDNSRIKIRTGENIGTNYRLAILRGIGANRNLKAYFEEKFPGVKCGVGAETYEEEGYQGGEYRKVRIELVVEDTFENLRPNNDSPPSKSYTLTVLPIISEDIEPKYKRDLAWQLHSAVEEPGITVVERGELDRVIDELKLNMGDLVDPKTARKVGKQIGAEKLVWSLITEYPESKWSIQTKIVDVETGISSIVSREENPVTASLSQLGRYVKEDGKSVVHWLRNYFHPQSTPSPNRLK